MELAADTNSDAYEEDSNVEDNDVEAEFIQEEQEEVSVGEKLNWQLPHHAGSSKGVHRFTGHERDLRKSEASAIDKETSPLCTVLLSSTAVIPFLRKRPVLMRSQTGNFNNVQEAARMSTDLLGMLEA
jgi:hypothetical protein